MSDELSVGGDLGENVPSANEPLELFVLDLDLSTDLDLRPVISDAATEDLIDPKVSSALESVESSESTKSETEDVNESSASPEKPAGAEKVSTPAKVDAPTGQRIF